MKEINYKLLAEQLHIKRLITEVQPTGIVSIVSDTFNLWDVLTVAIPNLKKEILAREQNDGQLHKVVIRPDSGDPVDILCGDGKSTKVETGWNEFEDQRSASNKGVVELLWETFGGTVNDKGYKVLHPAIGAIYGDSITVERATQICERLKAKGFASTNVVLGIGSYTYQMITRDSLGFAMKATSVVVKGEKRSIFKDPITDDGTKKSAKGRVEVYKGSTGNLYIADDNSRSITGPSDHEVDLLQILFKDGTFVNETSLAEVRSKLNGDS